jgi:hypothetical protein
MNQSKNTVKKRIIFKEFFLTKYSIKDQQFECTNKEKTIPHHFHILNKQESDHSSEEMYNKLIPKNKIL